MKALSLFSARPRTSSSGPEPPSGRGAPERLPYKPLLEIGRGGMGVVTLALARGPDDFAKLVVLKRLHEHLLADSESVQMLLDEARISARLSHPNVVQVYEATLHRGAPTIVMEYVEGLSLSQLMAHPTPLPLDLYLTVLIQVLRGLDAAHDFVDYDGRPLHLVHRDMSPHNVIVGYDGVAKVLDFGIAKVVGSDQGATRTGVLKGKLRYMAPEQIAGDDIDRRSDVFSVGVMLWEAIAGQRLWGNALDGHVVRALLDGKIPALPSGDVNPRLAAVCQRALAAQPDARYATAGELRRDLQTCLESKSGELFDEALSGFLAQHFSHQRDDMRARIADRIQRTTSRPPRALAIAPWQHAMPHAIASWLATPRRRAIGALVLAAMASVVVLVATLGARLGSDTSTTAAASGRSAGVLAGAPCDVGFKSCSGRCVSNDRPENGCGAAGCGACSPLNATARCGRDGRCAIAVCYRGHDDCDGIADNGCETFVRTDPEHCGSCAAACPALPHAQTGCGDRCRIWRCDSGYEDCNGVTEDGCEVAVHANSSHCGACGNRCPGKQRCRQGQCRP